MKQRSHEVNHTHLGILPKESSLVNAMLLENGHLIFFALKAHFSCEIRSFSSLYVVKFTVQVIHTADGLIALETKVCKQWQK